MGLCMENRPWCRLKSTSFQNVAWHLWEDEGMKQRPSVTDMSNFGRTWLA
jgi:hypothetical protein